MSDDERAIRELVESWMSSTKSGDLKTVLGLMADDVLFMTPQRAPFGKEEFRSSSEAMKDAEISGRARIEELEVAGNWAWVRNHIDLTVAPPQGPEIHRSGYTLTILRKEPDGRWRLFRDANLVS